MYIDTHIYICLRIQGRSGGLGEGRHRLEVLAAEALRRVETAERPRHLGDWSALVDSGTSFLLDSIGHALDLVCSYTPRKSRERTTYFLGKKTNQRAEGVCRKRIRKRSVRSSGYLEESPVSWCFSYIPVRTKEEVILLICFAVSRLCGEALLRVFSFCPSSLFPGTGIVHCAPAFGEDDYRVCMQQGYEVSAQGPLLKTLFEPTVPQQSFYAEVCISMYTRRTVS